MIAHSLTKVILCCLPSLVFAHSVQAYTLTTVPFTDPVDGVTPCYVDEANLALNKIVMETKGSTPDTVLSQINPQDFKDLSDSMTCAYQAALLGVQKVPAVVVDERYVVYGNTDMTGAVAEIENAINS